MDVEQRARELPPLPTHKGLLTLHNTGGVSQFYGYTEKQMREYATAAIAALTSPEEPDQALLVSMAVCLDHGFGMATLERQESRLRDMRKLWDEVMGRGYYSPENRERYAAMLAACPEVKP